LEKEDGNQDPFFPDLHIAYSNSHDIITCNVFAFCLQYKPTSKGAGQFTRLLQVLLLTCA